MKPKSRGNGQGTAYKRGTGWEACVTLCMVMPDDPSKKPYPKKMRKGNFPTKAAALRWCAEVKAGKRPLPKISLAQVYNEWCKKYEPRVGDSTMAGYKAAYKHFEPLHGLLISQITAKDLQDCMDACPAGHRTHQMMKVVSGLIWGYAFDAEYVEKDITRNLYTGKGSSKSWEPLNDDEIKTIKAAFGKEPYAEYIYILCYLGFRPGEFLRLKKTDLHQEKGVTYLTGGSKTEAGKDRRVPVPAAILDLVTARLAVEDTDLLFPQYVYSRKGEFTGLKQMSDAYFRESVFKPMMSRLGIARNKVPYSIRHTYSDKLKNAAGSDKTKAAIFGHTDYEFTQKKYQSTTLSDIKKVSRSIK